MSIHAFHNSRNFLLPQPIQGHKTRSSSDGAHAVIHNEPSGAVLDSVQSPPAAELLQQDEPPTPDEIAAEIIDEYSTQGWPNDPVNESELAAFLSDLDQVGEFIAAQGGDPDQLPEVVGAVFDQLSDSNGNILVGSDREQVASRMTLDPTTSLDAARVVMAYDPGSLDAARALLSFVPPTSNDPADWTSEQLTAFNTLASEFGRQIEEQHLRWHDANANGVFDPGERGSGGVTGEGSGIEFLSFHHDIMLALEEYIGVPPPADWDPTTVVPPELLDPDPDDNPRLTDFPDVALPSWLDPNGDGTEIGDRDFGSTVEIDGVTYGSLSDFENPDQLGQAIGWFYHGAGHGRMRGTMGSFSSVLDPAFYLWHGHIDQLVQQWLETPNGQSWLSTGENAESPLITGGGTVHVEQ